MYPALLSPDYVSIKRRDITANPFAMQTAFPPSDYYGLIRLPERLRSPRFLLSSPTRFLRELLRISQVPVTTLYTCHGLITPPVRHNLATTVALHGLRLRYKPGQLGLTTFGAIPTLQGHGIPYGLHNSLSTLHVGCSPDCVLTLESVRDPQTPRNAQDSIRVVG